MSKISTRLTNSTVENNDAFNDAFKAMQIHLEFTKMEALSLLAKLSQAEIALIPIVAPMIRNDLDSIMAYFVLGNDPRHVDLSSSTVLKEIIEWFPTHTVNQFPEALNSCCHWLNVIDNRPVMPDGLIAKLVTAKKFSALIDSMAADFRSSCDGCYPKVDDRNYINEANATLPTAQPILLQQVENAGFTNPQVILYLGGTALLSFCLVLCCTLPRQADFLRKTVKDGVNKVFTLGSDLTNSTLTFFKGHSADKKPNESALLMKDESVDSDSDEEKTITTVRHRKICGYKR